MKVDSLSKPIQNCTSQFNSIWQSYENQFKKEAETKIYTEEIDCTRETNNLSAINEYRQTWEARVDNAIHLEEVLTAEQQIAINASNFDPQDSDVPGEDSNSDIEGTIQKRKDSQNSIQKCDLIIKNEKRLLKRKALFISFLSILLYS